jgi:hypothetical protein
MTFLSTIPIGNRQGDVNVYCIQIKGVLVKSKMENFGNASLKRGGVPLPAGRQG